MTDTVRKKTLEAAIDATTQRGEQYAPPAETFPQIAALWSAILGKPVQAYEVALCLIAMKTVRIMHDPTHMDSWIDAAGYAACGAECVAEGVTKIQSV